MCFGRGIVEICWMILFFGGWGWIIGWVGSGYERILVYIERSTGLIERLSGLIERWTRLIEQLSTGIERIMRNIERADVLVSEDPLMSGHAMGKSEYWPT
ncbi:hypothetical protein CSV67_09100 [Sporosarcina sp. P2]|nr:hypothetical protein CSV67_09100 [Sporosarcina sp. P2]